MSKMKLKRGDTLQFGQAVLTCLSQRADLLIEGNSELLRRGCSTQQGTLYRLHVGEVLRIGSRRIVFAGPGRFAEVEVSTQEACELEAQLAQAG